MPVLDGIDATIELREHPELARLPIIAMTANAQSEDRERCLAAGMNDHLAKRIEPEALWATLGRWVQAVSPEERPEGPGGATSPPDACAAPPTADLPRQIPGLDAELGLSQLMGKRALYPFDGGARLPHRAMILRIDHRG